MSESSESQELKISIKPSSGTKFEVAISATAKVSELKSKVEAQSQIPPAQQRLIYAGRVLKDNDDVGSYKIKDGQTVHLVKGAAPGGGGGASTTTTSSSSSPSGTNNNTNTSTTQNSQNNTNSSVPTNIAAGQGSGNMLADLTGARYAGMANLPSASMFGPDGGMSSPDNVLNMLDQPGMAGAMREMLNNPAMVDMLINSNPQLQAMAPQFRQMMQSEQFRNMLSDPQAIRQMVQMQQMMGGLGGGAGAGGAGAAGGFPAPGTAEQESTNNESGNSNSNNSNSASTTAGQNAANPFAALMGGGQNQMPAFDPSLFASLMNPQGAGAQQRQEPEDDRPPEVRYESQLAQLNELGFYDFDRNVAALRRAGGNVQGAIEALLDGQV